MKKTGCLLVLLALAAMGGGGYWAYSSIKGLVDKAKTGQVAELPVSSGASEDSGVVSVEPDANVTLFFMADDPTGSTAFEIPIQVSAFDDNGDPLLSETSLVNQSMSKVSGTVMGSDTTILVPIPGATFRAPADGKVRVRIQVAPTATLGGLKNPRVAVNDKLSEGDVAAVVKGALGAFGGVCVGMVLGLIGLIVFIIGLFKGGKKQQPVYQQVVYQQPGQYPQPPQQYQQPQQPYQQPPNNQQPPPQNPPQ